MSTTDKPIKLTKEQKGARKKLFALVKKNTTKPEQIDAILKEYDLPITIENQIKENMIFNCAKSSTNVNLLEWLYNNGCPIKDRNNSDGVETCFEYAISYSPYHSTNTRKMLQWFQDKGHGLNKMTLKEWQELMFSRNNPNYLTWIDMNYDILELDENGNTYFHNLMMYKYASILHLSIIPFHNKNNKKFLQSQKDKYDLDNKDHKYSKYFYQRNKYFYKFRDTHVDINAQNYDGDTAAHFAIRHQLIFLFISLYVRGTNIDIPNNKSVTARDEFYEIYNNIRYNPDWECTKAHIKNGGKSYYSHTEFDRQLESFLELNDVAIILGDTLAEGRKQKIERAQNAKTMYHITKSKPKKMAK